MNDNVSNARLEAWLRMQAENAKQRAEEPEQPLNGGDGGGTSGVMEARVAKLESDMEHVKKGVDRIESGINDLRKGVSDLQVKAGTLDERSKRFTTRWDVFMMLCAFIAVVGGIVALSVRFIPPAG
jgi:hypothetical protein